MKAKLPKQLVSDQLATPLVAWLKLATAQSSGGNLLLGSGEESGWYTPQRLYVRSDGAAARWQGDSVSIGFKRCFLAS
jgi:hypothetical protein